MRTLVEVPSFSKDANEIIGQDILEDLKEKIAKNPRIAGDLIADTGGFRKIRARVPGGGERGGARVFYYVPTSNARPVYLVLCIRKSDDGPFTKKQKAQLKVLASELDSSNVYDLAASKGRRTKG